MVKINILSIGKIKHSWLEEALDEYTKRLSPYATINWRLVKNLTELEKAAEKEMRLICLDPKGREQTSEEFSSLIQKEGSRMCFVIGGDVGLSEMLKKRAAHLLSLSRLTFTHQLTRLILLEQLYRAFEIERGSPYHK